MKSAARSPLSLLALAALAVAVGAGAEARTPPPPPDLFGPTADYPVVIGDPYVVAGTTFTPSDTLNYDAVGYALAGPGEGVSGGHHTLPIPSYVEVTSLDSGRTALVRLDRRGPMDSPALIQLSAGALAQIGIDSATAHAAVRVRRVNPPEQERALLRTGQQAPARMDTPPGLLSALRRKLGATPSQSPDESATAVLSPPTPAPRGTAASAPVPPRPAPVMATPVPARPASPATAPVPARPALVQPTSARPAADNALAVQVGAFSSRPRAEAVAKAVGGAVTPAGRVFRVRVNAATRAEAEAALAKVRRAGYADARILLGG